MARKAKQLARDVAVIGGAMSRFGAFADLDSRDLMAEAYAEALDSIDKPLDPADIEALYIGNFTADLFEGQSHLGHLLADRLGLTPRPATRVEGACASSGLAFRQGVMAIASGMCDIVLVGGVEKMTHVSTEQVQQYLAAAGDVAMEVDQAGLTFPGIFAAIATAYFTKYGATREHLMHVAVKNHDNGARNEKAHLQSSLAQIMHKRQDKARKLGKAPPQWDDEFAFLADDRVNPPVAEPLHMFDCSPISDGAACAILAAADIAKNFTDDVVKVRATAQTSAAPPATWNSDLTQLPAAQSAAAAAYDMAGVGPGDIDFAEVHDCFTPAEIIATEDLGFFKPGHGAPAAADGLTSRQSDRPINNSGGLKAKGHPVGATGVAQLQEVWRQLRGKAGGHQMTHKDLRLGLTHNVGGTGGTCVIHILERL